MSLGAPEGAAGSVYRALVFINKGSRSCELQGFPGVSYVTGDDGHQVGPAAERSGDRGDVVRIAPGGTASAQLRLVNVGSYDAAVTTGPDGALWITLVHSGRIARLETCGRLDIHELDSPTCRPAQITAGPDGALWFTRTGDDRIGRITTGQATSFPDRPR